MPARPERPVHPRPFLDKSLNSKTLHFSICDVQSRMRMDRPDDLVLAYTQLMMGFLLFSPDPRHIAMIGLGGGSLAKFCHRYLPEARIQVLEINPHVIALRDEFQVPADNHRFHVRKEDGADHVRTTSNRYDVIVADGFDADGVPPNLCSQAFYDDCCNVLAPGGVLVANLHAGHRQFSESVERMAQGFAGNVVLIDELECNNVIAFALKEGTPAVLSANLERCAATLAPEARLQLEPSFARIRDCAWRSDGTALDFGG